jgi:hypothetical protein
MHGKTAARQTSCEFIAFLEEVLPMCPTPIPFARSEPRARSLGRREGERFGFQLLVSNAFTIRHEAQNFPPLYEL